MAAEAEGEERHLFGGEDVEDDDEIDDDDDEMDDDDDDDDEEQEEIELHPRGVEGNENLLKRKPGSENGFNFPSTSSASSFYYGNPQNAQAPNPNLPLSTVVVSLQAPPSAIAALSSPERKRLKAAGSTAFEDSRRIFQRLWTDEDEVSLLQGFLDYTTERRRRGGRGGSTNYDTGPFYDQMRTRLQFEFNKNQLVEKLRRLKKKYRNAVIRMSSGKDFSFKSTHDQITYELSKKIWSNSPLDDNDDQNGHSNYLAVKQEQSWKDAGDAPVAPPKMEDNLPEFPQPAAPVTPLAAPSASAAPITAPSAPAAPISVPNVIEDTVRSCLSPLFKELLHYAMSGPSNSTVEGLALNPLPLSFGGNSLNISTSEAVDERWRKQQILELEVYSKRLELVQEQVKSTLEELKSMEK